MSGFYDLIFHTPRLFLFKTFFKSALFFLLQFHLQCTVMLFNFVFWYVIGVIQFQIFDFVLFKWHEQKRIRTYFISHRPIIRNYLELHLMCVCVFFGNVVYKLVFYFETIYQAKLVFQFRHIRDVSEREL